MTASYHNTIPATEARKASAAAARAPLVEAIRSGLAAGQPVVAVAAALGKSRRQVQDIMDREGLRSMFKRGQNANPARPQVRKPPPPPKPPKVAKASPPPKMAKPPKPPKVVVVKPPKVAKPKPAPKLPALSQKQAIMLASRIVAKPKPPAPAIVADCVDTKIVRALAMLRKGADPTDVRCTVGLPLSHVFRLRMEVREATRAQP